jgi:DNA-binding transcriptional ArsR family regulator
MARTEPDDRLGQARDLLGLLGDERAWLVVRALLREPRTAKQLEADTGLDQPQVSRALKPLRLAGIVVAPVGRGGALGVRQRGEVFAVIRAADALAEAVNAARTADQAVASRQTRKDQLAGERAPGAAIRRPGGE